jgi:pyridoxamine 5'-phosphate oxidase-like protein
MLDPDVRRVLDGTSIAHLATVLPDGSPHATPVYVGAHGDRIVFFTGPGMRKARNLRRDPRMALTKPRCGVFGIEPGRCDHRAEAAQDVVPVEWGPGPGCEAGEYRNLPDQH